MADDRNGCLGNGGQCTQLLEEDWRFCPSCGRTQFAYVTQRGGQTVRLVGDSRPNLASDAWIAAVVLGGFGPLLIVGIALDLVILGPLGIRDDPEQFGFFPVGVAVGGLLTLSGFALWLTLKQRKFGGSEP